MIKTGLQGNSLDLRTILDMVNNLPNKGSGTGEDISAELTAQDALISEISLALDEVAVAQADAFAAIGVTYSEGSTCTCSCGDITLTAKNTSGQVLFLVPNAGEWTVTATNGTDTKSKSVNITTEGQLESVELKRQYLFQSGVGASVGFKGAAGDMDTGLSTCLRFYNTLYIGFTTVEKISLKSGQTIVLEFSTGSLNNFGYSYTLAVANKNDEWDDFNSGDPNANAGVAQAKAIPSAVGVRTTIRLPIDFSGDFYIGGGCYYNSGAAVDEGLAVYNLYIE